jgi:hypothetical protein
MENIQFRNVSDKFLTILDNDLKKMKTLPNVLVLADKTKNVYETTPKNNSKIVKENVTKTYKLTENNGARRNQLST